MKRASLLLILPVLLCSCRNASRTGSEMEEAKVMSIDVTSPAFDEGESIPAMYVCDGANISPPLEWTPGPDKTESYVVVLQDPDAPRGTFTHWLIYNIPSDMHKLGENIPTRGELADGIEQGRNSANKVGYSGPCPPRGEQHRYRFKVFALDAVLDIPSQITVDKLNDAMDGHVVGEGTLHARYGGE